ILNYGVSGDDTSDLLKRFDKQAKKNNPYGIIIAIGGNDTQFFIDKNRFRIDIKEFESNFDILIKKAKQYTENIIIIGLTNVDEQTINNEYIPKKNKFYKNETIKKYDKLLEQISKDNNLKFIEVFDILDKNDFTDGLHPTSQGHIKLYNKIKNNISEKDFN
ncbi:MAG: hypothetical protein HRU03_09150, partial [Nanoarchaeales archaeon]|nr:hypothetical protein [Nanoarchaeales archaeon]